MMLTSYQNGRILPLVGWYRQAGSKSKLSQSGVELVHSLNGFWCHLIGLGKPSQSIGHQKPMRCDADVVRQFAPGPQTDHLTCITPRQPSETRTVTEEGSLFIDRKHGASPFLSLVSDSILINLLCSTLDAGFHIDLLHPKTREDLAGEFHVLDQRRQQWADKSTRQNKPACRRAGNRQAAGSSDVGGEGDVDGGSPASANEAIPQDSGHHLLHTSLDCLLRF